MPLALEISKRIRLQRDVGKTGTKSMSTTGAGSRFNCLRFFSLILISSPRNHSYTIVPTEQTDFADIGPVGMVVPEGKTATWT